MVHENFRWQSPLIKLKEIINKEVDYYIMPRYLLDMQILLDIPIKHIYMI